MTYKAIRTNAQKTLSNTIHEEHIQVSTLHMLDEQCIQQQRGGQYPEALQSMEGALVIRRKLYGAESPEFAAACKAMADMYNLLSMMYLQQENYKMTLEHLEKAKVLAQNHPLQRATTLNNLACYYRRTGKLNLAETCLKSALAIEKKLNNHSSTADTHLNLCAVLSQLNQHQRALKHAQKALTNLEKETAMSNPPAVSTVTSDRLAVVCIAHHNVGVELDFLHDYENALACYKKGADLAEQYFGAEHQMASSFRNSYIAAKRLFSTKRTYPSKQPNLAHSMKIIRMEHARSAKNRHVSQRFGKHHTLAQPVARGQFSKKSTHQKQQNHILPPLALQTQINDCLCSLNNPFTKPLHERTSSSITLKSNTLARISSSAPKLSLPNDLPISTPRKSWFSPQAEVSDNVLHKADIAEHHTKQNQPNRIPSTNISNSQINKLSPDNSLLFSADATRNTIS